MALLRDTVASPTGARISALGLKAVVLAALSIAVMVIDLRQQRLKMLRETLATAVYPLQAAVHSPFAGWDWLQQNLATRRTLLDDNARLKAKVEQDDSRLLHLEAIEQENAQLRDLVHAAPRAADHVALASIMHLEFEPYRQRVLIDRGAQAGVYRGQAVIDATGVFGQVTNVGPFSAEVILLSDAAHAVPVEVARNGLRTIAAGTGDPHRLALPYLPRNADVQANDVLLSSGLGGVFPAGYPVGRVIDIKRDPSQPLATVSVEPAAALDRDREVLLVWSAQPPPAPPSEETPAGKPPRRREPVPAPRGTPQ